MDDIVTLGIKIDSLQAEVAAQRLNRLTREGTQAERSALNLGAAYKVASIGAVAFGAALFKILSKTSEFQVLNAQLITATGSLQGANQAFAALKVLATTTPFTLQEVTTAFTKLVNYGLTPSERAIRSYGDAAAATGKPIISLVEGVADAVNGEFERVKEAFNVKAKNLGDTVAFRFRGVTTEVKNNAKEIEEYFVKLGETKFSGAMERQMDTLKGKTSNLVDAWELMLNAIGSGKLSEAAKSGLTNLTGVLNDITTWAESGKLDLALSSMTAQINGQTPQWESLFSTMGKVLIDGTRLIGEFVANAEQDSDEWKGYWEDVFTNFPSNIEYMVKLSQIHLDGFLSKAAEAARKFGNLFDPDSVEAKNFATWAGDQTAKLLSPEKRAQWEEEKTEKAKNEALSQGYSPLGGGAPPDHTDEGETIDQRVMREIDALNEENDAIRRNTKVHVDRARELQDLYDGMVLPPKGGFTGPFKTTGPPNPYTDDPSTLGNPNADPLAGFYQGGDSTTSNAKAGKPKKAKIVKEKSGRVEEAEYKSQMPYSIYEKEAQNELEALGQQEARIRDSYESRKADILAITDLTEQEKLRLMEQAERQYSNAQEDFQRKRAEAQLGIASDFFGDLSTMAMAYGKKGYKIAQAAAVAQTTIDTYTSATAAYKSLVGIPYVGPALAVAAAGAAVAAGFMNIQRIKSTEYAGSYAMGGVVPGNSPTGDNLTAKVNSGEMILNQGQQRKLFDIANGGQTSQRDSNGGNPWKLNIVNTAPGYTAAATEDREQKIMEITINKTIDRISAQVATGGGKVDSSFARAFKLQR